ncbi:MAG: LysR family transcriptional regulator [Butyrivibrio sp.]|nr:LysR family transcriptional regulator [Butyrivibrio sp.]
MIEIAQLEQLLAFAKYGTLSSAAEHLHMSQPTLTRAMKKLEEEFCVSLFEHRKNKLTLNENGLLAVEYARKVLNEADDMLNKVRHFDRAKHTISIGSCAPAPLWDISPMLSSLYPQMTISTEIKDTPVLLAGLLDETYRFVILPEKFEHSDCNCIRCGEENLSLSLPVSHPLADSAGIYLKDMDGENMLLYSDIGFWHNLHKNKMPHSRFLLQNERFAFNELVTSSILPSFTSDIVQRHPEQNNTSAANRVTVPILDEEAHVTYYCCYLKKHENQLQCFIQQIKHPRILMPKN